MTPPFQPSEQSLLQTIQNSLQQITPTEIKQNISKFLSGTAAFYTTSLLSQWIQYQLKISTGTRPSVIPVVLGVGTVAMGSIGSHLVGVGFASCWNEWGRLGCAKYGESFGLQSVGEVAKVGVQAMKQCVQPMRLLFERDERLSVNERKERREVWIHFAGVCILGILTYKTILRSHFTSLSPSSYTARGSFARIGIPAPPNFNYATSTQRAQLERLGRTFGCHTCGTRKLFSSSANKPMFHGDHIPPVSVAKQLNERWYRKTFGIKVVQKFYPQCRECSNRQGGLLSKAVAEGKKNLHSVGGGSESYFHKRFRVGHLTGGIVALGTVGDGKNVVEGSRERVLGMYDWFVDVGRGLMQRFQEICK